ncbi:YcnI family protein [Nakamurella endophytica]|uniref:YncI copper-binding domain-containing protein n=1 Tax=Nakamurella endophytica TaxID=1748367 RepID=A0A917WJU4_9ACTN|nr:YcnI family protein [Nakamurella endophytica]GGM09264.1 hypothetical protein GCM10011594_31460 [Nakamurella endophytica]
MFSKARRHLVRGFAAAATVVAVLVGSASPAWAHLDIDPGVAAPGDTATLTFRVPNESATASTVMVQIQIPAATPLAQVRFEQTAGWTARADKTKLTQPVTQGNFTITEAVTSVTFTARDGNALPPGSYGDFSLTVGPLPNLPEMAFPAVQTYDNGDIVRWNQDVAASGEEPEFPTPTLVLRAAGAQSGAASAAPPSGDPTATDAAIISVTGIQASDSAARILSVIAIVVAAAAALVVLLGEVG